MIFVWRGCVIFYVESLLDFLCEEEVCMTFVWRGCMIFCVERLRDFSHSFTFFLWRLCDFFVERVIFCGEGDFFVERLRDFVCGEVV